MAEGKRDPGITRRQFVAGASGILGGTMAAVVALPGVGYLIAPALKRRSADDWVPLGPVDELVEDEPTLFSFVRSEQVGWETASSTYGVYVTKRSGGNLDVFSSQCTHLSCRVRWEPELGEFVCPCHDGRFARNGDIVSGPQPRPLDRYEHRIREDGIIEVHVVEA